MHQCNLLLTKSLGDHLLSQFFGPSENWVAVSKEQLFLNTWLHVYFTGEISLQS
jgi:thiamine phosphate synthase YjbQ (UPF0047 family)